MNCEFITSWLFSKVIFREKRYFKRILGSPVKNCPRISLICLSESSIQSAWALTVIAFDKSCMGLLSGIADLPRNGAKLHARLYILG